MGKKLKKERGNKLSGRKVAVNKKHKDRLFCMLFGDSENKKNILSLYNALNGTQYTDADDLTITTIDDVIYVGMKNDVSFLLDSFMSLWEQQSTYNPNMPVRGLIYFGELYDSYIEQKKLNIYGSKLVKLPTPQYIVFYNGKMEKEPEEELRLSDSFQQADKSGRFEWTARMININKGKNQELLKQCKPLADYVTFIAYIREYQQKGYNINEAVDKSVNKCIEEDILAEFLQKHRAEVFRVCLKEFNKEVYEEGIREESREEGRMEGRVRERIENIRTMLKNGRSKEYILDLDMKYTEKEIEQAETEEVSKF